MMTLDSDLFKCCHSLTVLRWVGDDQALSLLERATTQVRPIMAKRKWTVPLVAEFYPPSSNLLGLNHNRGAKIQLRVRSPNSPDVFLPYETILGTLLHELAHIEVGPHDARFYKLLDELNEECDELIAGGNDGTGSGNSGSFAGRGRRVGQGVTVTVPKHLAGERAVVAARNRERMGRLMPRGGRRLGGSADIARLCDPREMALAAAQRRARDDVWCGGAVENGDGEDAMGVIDVDAEDEEDEVQIVGTRMVRKKEVKKVPPRLQARKVPVRQNAAAIAALQRAERRR